MFFQHNNIIGKLLEKKVGTKYTCLSKNKYCLFTTELMIPNSNTRPSIVKVNEGFEFKKIEFLLMVTFSNELKLFKKFIFSKIFKDILAFIGELIVQLLLIFLARISKELREKKLHVSQINQIIFRKVFRFLLTTIIEIKTKKL